MKIQGIRIPACDVIKDFVVRTANRKQKNDRQTPLFTEKFQGKMKNGKTKKAERIYKFGRLKIICKKKFSIFSLGVLIFL
jgi:hypothetical protein